MSFREANQAVINARQHTSVLATNKVLRNTYFLLSLTLLFSAATAGFAMFSGAQPISPWITLIAFYGLLFVVHKTANSAAGLFWVFALTGFMGYTLGPILNMFITMQANGSQLVMMALGGAGAIFFTLSGIALTTKKDFSFMGSFLMVGFIVAILAMVGALIFNLPGLSLAVSAMILLLSSGVILWETSNIIHGGETNYIRATVSLYVQIYNLFVSLLHLLSFFTGNNE